MTRKEFIKVLKEQGYSYKTEGDKIVVTKGNKEGDVILYSLKTLPPGVEFKNWGNVHLTSLETLPPDVEFNNVGGIGLNSLETLPPGVEFKNGKYVILDSLKTFPRGVEFRNKENVYLRSLVGGMFHKWSGNIEGINPTRLLNKMIADGLFDR